MNTSAAGSARPTRTVSIVLSVVAATALAGCASSYHYSQLVGERYFKAEIDTYPVLITEVDGRFTSTGIPVLVDAGTRTIVVQGPPTFVNLQETRSFTLDVKPCTRYYLVAVKLNKIDNDFSVKVDYQEPLSGCTPAPSS